MKKSPLTNDKVYQGICIRCYPELVPTDYIESVWKAKKLAAVDGETIRCELPRTSLPDGAINNIFPFGGGPPGSMKIELRKDETCLGFINDDF